MGAKRIGIKTGGVAPQGYRTEVREQSKALKEFGLSEHQSSDYKCKTIENVISSDATLVVAVDVNSNGTCLTIHYCEEFRKPYLVIKSSLDCVFEVQSFVEKYRLNVLNIAGNRKSVSKGIASKTAAIIQAVFE
ncbi:MAG: putative molybdenum carrier protein [Candidatus Thiodiazotropha endolucinida]|uniref:Molybdenum carrier protein n=1 Tax=Candidatus Thiodiazotropha taylori TaxID=2792791 RepID=A0A9E4N307_9GAMM|nr:putative molybdenum carrier protein [Candidatus Thiodiazotropha taylori]